MLIRGYYSRSFEQLSRNSFTIPAQFKEKGPELKAFLLITALFLIAAYYAGILPGGIQW